MEKKNKVLLIQIGLLVLTFVTTTLAGVEWRYSKFIFWTDFSWQDFMAGMAFSIPFLSILTVHEFGHFFTARYHKIKVTLPYYIPMWFGFFVMPSIGTMGAFIRIKESISSRLKYFDVGVSGPLAGFVLAIGALWYGFTSLPETEYIYEIHPEYELFGKDFESKMAGLDTVILKSDLNPERLAYESLRDTIRIGKGGSIHFGDNLLMWLGREYIAPDDRYVPSSHEIMHYPWLLAGFLALFFTALNLLPIGQLDGGHVLFGLLGAARHAVISRIIFTIFLFYAGLGWIQVSDLENSSLESLGLFVLSLFFYLYLLYISSASVFIEVKDRLLYATAILTTQFFVSSFFGIDGYHGWLAFGVLIGRFIGIDHPPVLDNRPLSTNRKIVGWLALVIFILSFSPEPLVVDGI
ncbi:MAG: site-2 protease family protein [Bacteroidota bacterium]